MSHCYASHINHYALRQYILNLITDILVIPLKCLLEHLLYLSCFDIVGILIQPIVLRVEVLSRDILTCLRNRQSKEWISVNGRPKQAENVACGSLIPASVPAIFAV